MPNALSTSSIVLPASVATVVAGKAKDTSTIATLSPNAPKPFSDDKYLIFNGDSEAEVVEEGAARSGYTQEIPEPIVGKRFTVQTVTRVSKQLMWADEDDQLEIINAIQEDQAKAMGRALDYVVYHAVQPKTGLALSGYTALHDVANKTYLGNEIADATDDQLIRSIDNMAELVNDLYDINGVAIAKTYSNALRKIRIPSSMTRLYPEIPLNLNVGVLEGVNAACSGTVNGRLAQTPTNVLAFMGDFSMIKWGYVREMTAELIPYGDPDGQGDLKRYGQVAYQTEATYVYSVVAPDAFAVLLGGADPSGN